MSGIYVHVPFCKSKCTYCDFASYPREIEKAELYFACLYKEIKGRAEALKDRIFNTVYFGGGTPSFVDEKYIVGAMRQIKKYYNLTPDCEITLELNPGTLSADKVKAYKNAGINRFSIGLQSADDSMLRRLNRIHTTEDFLLASKLLEGENISVDVMIGLEDQKPEDVKATIDLAVEIPTISGWFRHIPHFNSMPCIIVTQNRTRRLQQSHYLLALHPYNLGGCGGGRRHAPIGIRIHDFALPRDHTTVIRRMQIPHA